MKKGDWMRIGTVRKGIAWILLLAVMAGCASAFAEGTTTGPYEKAAASIVRDWRLLDLVSFACETSGSAEGMFPEYGIYMDVEQGSLFMHTDTDTLLLLYGGTDESWMQALLSLPAHGVNMRIVSLGVVPGLCTEEETELDFLYAMGAALNACLHCGTALPVYLKDTAGEWAVCPEQTMEYALALYANLGGGCPAEICVSAGEDVNAADLAAMDMAANDYIRCRMIDYIPYSAEEYASWQPGAYVIDTPNDLALMIRTEDTAHLFWFLNATGMEEVLGYTVETFYAAGIYFDAYDLGWIRVDEEGNADSGYLTTEEKVDLMKAFITMDLWEAGDLPAGGE